jgi:hypothetical protein
MDHEGGHRYHEFPAPHEYSQYLHEDFPCLRYDDYPYDDYPRLIRTAILAIIILKIYTQPTSLTMSIIPMLFWPALLSSLS